MRKVLIFLSIVLLLFGAACASRAPEKKVVAPNATVIARFNPDNNIIIAVKQAASELNLGPVSAVGFKHSCNPVASKIVLCRDPSLTQGQAVPTVGENDCVVRLDPKLGNGPRAESRIKTALSACL